MSIPNTEFWNDFIEMFRNENTLWEIKSDNYKNKIKRDQSWSKLTQKYKEIEPEADVNTVKKKLMECEIHTDGNWQKLKKVLNLAWEKRKFTSHHYGILKTWIS